MGPLPAIAAVVENDLCIACGACVHACPAGAVEPAYDACRGAHEVRIADPAACAGCPAPCDRVCPSLDVDLPALLGAPEVPRMGPLRSVSVGYAPDHVAGGVSSSGGILRAFIQRAAEEGRPTVCLGRRPEGWGPIVVRSKSDLGRVPGSIYHSVSFADCIPLLRSLEEPCLLIATPCQLEGVRKYAAEVEPELEGRIALAVGLVCGWMYSDRALAAFASYKGIEEPVLDAAYRGEDKVGLLKLRTASGERRFHRRVFGSFSSYLDYRASFASPANRLRCRLCEDHVNVLADVAVGDAWLRRCEGRKLSIVLVRTERGERALRRLEELGEAVLEPASPADVIESQSANLVEGRTARALSAWLAESGVRTPRFVFRPGEPPARPSPAERRGFARETRLRRLLREELYLRYRRAYFLGGLRRTLRDYLRMRVLSALGRDV